MFGCQGQPGHCPAQSIIFLNQLSKEWKKDLHSCLWGAGVGQGGGSRNGASISSGPEMGSWRDVGLCLQDARSAQGLAPGEGQEGVFVSWRTSAEGPQGGRTWTFL